MPIEYNPTFQHEEWVDNVDRVQASGDNGFNIRFNAIEAEFQGISQVVQEIDTALGSLGEEVRAPVTIGIMPVFLPFGASPQWSSIFWSRTFAGQQLGTHVEKPQAAAQAWGALPLSLPNGATLIDIRVLGEQDGGGEVRTDLFQESRTEPYDRTILVTVTGLASASTPPTPFPAGVTYDGVANLYYLLVRAQDAAGSTIRFRGFHLTYQE